MAFANAVRSGFLNWRDFSGRATRPQYWYFTLFYALCSLVGDGLVAISAHVALGALRIGLLIGNLVILLVPMVPHLAVATRRLHDTVQRDVRKNTDFSHEPNLQLARLGEQAPFL